MKKKHSSARGVSRGVSRSIEGEEGLRGAAVRHARLQELLREELAGREDVAQIVAALERQYDAYVEAAQRPGLPAGEQAPLPSADEIGAEAEAFLRTLDD